MNLFQILEFTLNYSMSAGSRSAWIWVIITLLVFIFGLGLFWGKLWNKTWGFSGQLGQTIVTILFALLSAYAVFNLLAVSRVETWFEQQRMLLGRSLAESGRYNRSVLQAAWPKLQALGGQNGLTSPAEAGNELRINSPEEAVLLATVAADEVKSSIRSRPPFVWGAPLSFKSSAAVAAEAVDSVNFSDASYPVVITASNDWTSTAATIQANHTIDTSRFALKPGLDGLKQACLILLIVLVALQIILVPLRAVNDIKENPKV